MVQVINDRFTVDVDRAELADRSTGGHVHLEPRFLRVLQILMDQNGQTVSRETLVEAVWGNYGGGDEALTQAISHLRKHLDDPDRQLIQTIPKKGYRLEAQLAEVPELTSGSVIPPFSVLIMLLMVILGIYLAIRYYGHPADAPVVPPTEQSEDRVETPAPEG
jgi:DNA-binding winged helix-turn-helix (wHTH) protein